MKAITSVHGAAEWGASRVSQIFTYGRPSKRTNRLSTRCR